MNIAIYFTPVFKLNLRRYKKKYFSIESDLKIFIENLADATAADSAAPTWKKSFE